MRNNATVNSLGKLIVARTAQGEFVAVGRAVGFADHPTIVIRRVDGSQLQWAAHLCVESDLEPAAVDSLCSDKLGRLVEVDPAAMEG